MVRVKIKDNVRRRDGERDVKVQPGESRSSPSKSLPEFDCSLSIRVLVSAQPLQ